MEDKCHCESVRTIACYGFFVQNPLILPYGSLTSIKWRFSLIVSQQLLKFKFIPAEGVRYGEIFTTNHSRLTYDDYLYKVDTGSPNPVESGD